MCLTKLIAAGPGADEFSGAAILELQSLIERLGLEKYRWTYPLVNVYITMENHHF
jgi:hypothetical protein